MISWIDQEHKKYYENSAKSSGIRYKFYNYKNDFDESTMQEINRFIIFLRKKYYFPIRLNILLCDTPFFTHHIDDHKYYGAFYSMEDEKRKVYPRISIAAKVTKTNSMDDVFFTLAHEITHYFQWYLGDEDKRSNRSLEIEANKWSKYILNIYYNDYLING